MATRFWRQPLDDYLAALDACGAGGSRSFIVIVPIALALAWWIYVPAHELLHAYGCLWTGGAVTRLEIDAIYGAAFLQPWFPFVAVGSDYAGQLTGFDTFGNDWIYLATDAAPFVLTVLFGVPLLKRAAASSPTTAAVQLGAAVPLAFAPFLSLPGDYYEMASVAVSGVLKALAVVEDPSRWRTDDVFLLADRLSGAGGWTLFDAGIVGASCLVAIVLAWATYGAGSAVARLVVRVPSEGGRLN